ncbi:hypothetical protein LTS18_003342 [Coniosporium uncinatum]|uniref:Uncharacterized protein n=1 Tax=Coniosporium uncinatum TaxID=93489 RepID=A0ACC3D752_9PEZI|nr:hypothetical protein LTS18_003342 [Coniosporium uncinatum]
MDSPESATTSHLSRDIRDTICRLVDALTKRLAIPDDAGDGIKPESETGRLDQLEQLEKVIPATLEPYPFTDEDLAESNWPMDHGEWLDMNKSLGKDFIAKIKSSADQLKLNIEKAVAPAMRVQGTDQMKKNAMEEYRRERINAREEEFRSNLGSTAAHQWAVQEAWAPLVLPYDHLRTDQGSRVNFALFLDFIRRQKANLPSSVAVAEVLHKMMGAWKEWAAKFHAQHNRLLDIYCHHQQLNTDYAEADLVVTHSIEELVTKNGRLYKLQALRQASVGEFNAVYLNLNAQHTGITYAQGFIGDVKHDFVNQILPIVQAIQNGDPTITSDHIERAAKPFYQGLAVFVGQLQQYASRSDMTVDEIRTEASEHRTRQESVSSPAQQATVPSADMDTEAYPYQAAPGSSLTSSSESRLRELAHQQGIKHIVDMPQPSFNPQDLASPHAREEAMRMLEKQRQDQRASTRETSNPAQDHLPHKPHSGRYDGNMTLTSAKGAASG